MESDPQPESHELSDRQLAVLPYLVSSPSVSEAARRADVHRSTLHQWMNDPEFRQELESARQDAADLARSELRGLMLKATTVLAESLEDPSPVIRLRASRYAIDLGLTRIHRRTAFGTALEEARGCSCESGIMVLKQKTGPRKGAPNRCCHRTNPTVSASSLTTTAWWPMPG